MRSHPDQKTQFLNQFKAQVIEIVDKNDEKQKDATEKAINKAKDDLRREIEEIQKEFQAELNEANLEELFTEEELDEFLLELLEKHRAQYAQSSGSPYIRFKLQIRFLSRNVACIIVSIRARTSLIRDSQ